jgi:hypothetical protein
MSRYSPARSQPPQRNGKELLQPLGAIIKTLAVSHASVQTPEQASRARLAQSARLHQESARLRQESKALVDRVQVLCDKSLHLLQNAAMLIVKPKV